MKTINYSKLFILISATLIFAVAGIAQETRPAETPSQNVEERPFVFPPRNLGTATLRQLGLTDEQMQQMRKLRMPALRILAEAHKRASEATRLLDEAIYADYAEDTEIQSKLQQLQQAQAEVSRLRYANELAVRRILTQEQLIRFRELRQRYEEMRNERVKQRITEFERQRPRKQMTPLPQPVIRPVREKPVL